MKVTHQFVILALMAALFAVVAGFGWKNWESHREVEQVESRLRETQAELQKVRAELARRDNLLRLSQSDPDYIARLARDQLGYVRPNEVVVTPQDSAPAPRATPALR